MPVKATARYVFLLMFLLWMPRGFAETVASWVAPKPDWVVEQAVADAPATSGTDESSDRSVLLRDTQERLIGDSPQVYERIVTRVDAATATADIGSLSLDYAPQFQRVRLHRARVLRDGIQSDRMTSARVEDLRRESELESQLIDGQRTLHVVLEDIRVGDVVDLAWSIEGTNPALAGMYMDALGIDQYRPVARRQVRLLYPADRGIEVRQYNHASPGSELPFTRSEHDGVVEWRLLADHLPAITSESAVPSGYIENRWLEVADPMSWADVVRWALPLYRMQADPRVRQQAEALREHAESPEAALRSAIRFVQDDIRYTGLEIGENAYRPHAPGDVLDRRFGDCKDKSVLLVSLLGEMGVQAEPALVSSWKGRRLRDALPAPQQFDHVIVRFRWNDQTYWVDPTATYQRGGLAQLSQSQLGSALPIAEDSTDLADMPDVEPRQPTIDIDEQVDLSAQEVDSAAGGDYRIRTIYRGEEADDLRRGLASNSREEVGRSFTSAVADYYPGAVQIEPPTFEDDDWNNTITVVEHYRLPEAWQKQSDGDGDSLQASLWFSEIDRRLARPRSSERTAPWAQAHPTWVRQRIHARLAPPWSPKTETEKVDDPHLHFFSRFRMADSSVDMQASLRTLSSEVPPADYTRFRGNLRKIGENTGYTLTVSGSGSAVDDAGDSGFGELFDGIDHRALWLLLAAFLPWLWTLFGLVGRSTSPWLGMYSRPRASMRAVDGHGGTALIVSLFAWVGLGDILANDRILNLAIHDGIGLAVLAMLVALFVSTVLAALSALLVGWIGKLLGGSGSARQWLTASAWAAVPVLGMSWVVVVALMLYGPTVMKLSEDGSVPSGQIMVIGLAILSQLPFYLWAWISWVLALAEVQRQSVAAAFASTLLVVVVRVVLTLAIVGGFIAVSA